MDKEMKENKKMIILNEYNEKGRTGETFIVLKDGINEQETQKLLNFVKGMQDCLRAHVNKSAACLNKAHVEIMKLNPQIQLKLPEQLKPESLITISSGVMDDLGDQMFSFYKKAQEIAEDLTQIVSIITEIGEMPTTPATKK